MSFGTAFLGSILTICSVANRIIWIINDPSFGSLSKWYSSNDFALLLDPYCLVAQPSSRPLTSFFIVCFDTIMGEIDIIISQAFVLP
jgi:hypothetical protein